MKYFNLLFAFVFLCFALLQYNDPDPIVWIPIYGLMSVFCVMAFRKKYFPPMALALAIGYLIYCAFLFPSILTWLRSDDKAMLLDELAKMQFPYIEESREFLGLVICLVVLGINHLASRSRTS